MPDGEDRTEPAEVDRADRLAGLLERVLAPDGADGPAVESVDGVLSRSQLRQRVDAGASALADAGIGTGSRVLLRMPVSTGYVVMLLASLARRAVVVPVGTSAAGDYLAAVRNATRPDVEIDPAGEIGIVASPGCCSTPRGVASIVFTSGSTGRPKGVVGGRDALWARVDWATSEFFSADAPRCAARVDPAFFDSLTEILGALAADRTLVVAPPDALTGLDALGRFVRDARVSQVTLTPSSLPALCSALDAPLPFLRRWVLSGEPLRGSWAAMARRLAPDAEIINSYGSTEVTGDVFFHRIARSQVIPEPVPLGRPARDVRWTTDGGELLIGGMQAALGYVGDDAGATLDDGWVRTGDVVRVVDDVLFYVGRVDGTDKVRGRRVDLLAVEALVEQVGGVAEVAAAMVAAEDGSHRLVAFVVPRDGLQVTTASCRAALAERCPDWLVPDRVQVVAALPRTAGGKVDRRALREEVAGPPSRDAFRSDLEFAVASAVAACAGSVTVDRDTPLVDLGVDSLQIVEIAARLTGTVGREIAVADLVGCGSVEAIAVMILAGEPSDVLLRPVRRTDSADVIVALPPAIGSGLAYFRLLPHLDPGSSIALVEQTAAAVEATRRHGCRGLAELVADAVVRTHPGRRVALFGWSFGAIVAVHLEAALRRRSVEVSGLALADPARLVAARTTDAPWADEDWAVRRILADFGYDVPEATARLSARAAVDLVRDAAVGPLHRVSANTLQLWVDTMVVNMAATREPFPPSPSAPALVLRGARTMDSFEYPAWAQGPTGDAPPIVCHDLDATHFELLAAPTVNVLGALVREFLEGLRG